MRRRSVWKTVCISAMSGILMSGMCFADDGGSSAGASFLDSGEYEPQLEEVFVTIPGMEGECSLLWVSDMHLCAGADDPDVTDEHRQDAQERYEMLRSPSGTAANDSWELLSGRIDSYGADYVIFGADMVDYASEENYSRLQEGLDRLNTPWIYIRADHDYGRWFSDMGIKKMRKLQRSIAPQNKLWTVRFDAFTVAGLDNTTTAIADETLEEFRALCNEGKPVILCTHVPFDTGSEDCAGLAALSESGWDDRVLCWGDGDEYDTSQGGNMKEMLDIITAPDSPVCAVLAGHLHQTWDGSLTDSCTGHVFSAAYEDHIGLITVSGE